LHVYCCGSHMTATQSVYWHASSCLATAVFSWFVSRSLPSNGSIRHTIFSALKKGQGKCFSSTLVTFVRRGLFNDAYSVSRLYSIGWEDDRWTGNGLEALMFWLRYYPASDDGKEPKLLRYKHIVALPCQMA
jgi:hypothetical protein